MAAIFWSHANSYVGDYSIVRRTPHKEFTEGYHYHDFYEAQFYFNNDRKQRTSLWAPSCWETRCTSPRTGMSS